MKVAMQIEREALSEKYLGLPTASGRLTDKQFEHIVESSRSRAQGWCEKMASFAAREVLIKSVLQSLSTYAMICFKLTKGLCSKLTTIASKYWWGGSLDRRGMHWQTWEKMSVAKGRGGLGFRDLQKFNDAMLGKQAWRLLVNPHSLCARVLKGRYYPNGDILSASCPKRASKVWRAIICGRDVLKRGLVRRVGDGNDTRLWSDPWLPGVPGLKPLTVNTDTNLSRVADLIDQASGQWNEELVRDTLSPMDAEAALRLPRPRHGGDDFWAWNEEKTGVYSVRSAYRLMVQDIVDVPETSNSAAMWKKLWRLRVIPKVRVFCWRAIKGFLPSYSELSRRYIMDNGTCKLCGHEEETLFHALVKCDHAKQFWSAAFDHFGVSIPRVHPASWLQDLLMGSFLSAEHIPIVMTLLWCIWSSRNKYVHGEEQYKPLGSMKLIEEQLSLLELPPSQLAKVKVVPKWERPLAGWSLVNTDGSLNCSYRRSWFGLCPSQ
jgi:hypothetical protein